MAACGRFVSRGHSASSTPSSWFSSSNRATLYTHADFDAKRSAAGVLDRALTAWKGPWRGTGTIRTTFEPPAPHHGPEANRAAGQSA